MQSSREIAAELLVRLKAYQVTLPPFERMTLEQRTFDLQVLRIKIVCYVALYDNESEDSEFAQTAKQLWNLRPLPLGPRDGREVSNSRLPLHQSGGSDGAKPRSKKRMASKHDAAA